MTNISPRKVRTGLVGIAIMLAVLFVASGGYSQSRPGVPKQGGMPPPGPVVAQPPINQITWQCSGCGKVLATGPTPPNISRCPSCGIRLDYVQGPDGQKRDMPSGSGTSTAYSVGYIVGTVFGVLVLAGIVIGIVFAIKGASKKKKPRRRRLVRDDDDDDRPRPRRSADYDDDDDRPRPRRSRRDDD